MKPLIVLNPGHEITDDRGFLGPETEGSNNRKVVAIMKKHLETHYICEVKVVEQPSTPFAKLGSVYPNATLFYSRHSNAFRGVGKGTEVFYHYGRTLAQDISIATAKILDTVTRGNAKGARRNSDQFNGAGYAVINQAVKAGVKYQLMAEIGFHDNPKENKLMVEKRVELATAEAEAIAKYLKLEVKPKPKVEDKKEVNTAIVYRVVVGSYANKTNAEELQAKLKKAGFTSFLAAYDTKK